VHRFTPSEGGTVIGGGLPDALLEWVARRTGRAHVERWTVQPFAGGAVSDRVERITLYLGSAVGHGHEISVVGKRAFEHEIAGLHAAAQAVRPDAAAIPELIASRRDAARPWLITTLCPGGL
jgi:hypothetical protein